MLLYAVFDNFRCDISGHYKTVHRLLSPKKAELIVKKKAEMIDTFIGFL